MSGFRGGTAKNPVGRGARLLPSRSTLGSAAGTGCEVVRLGRSLALPVLLPDPSVAASAGFWTPPAPSHTTRAMSDPAPPPPSLLARVWRLAGGVFVFLVVAWHLFFLVVRNPLDLWGDEIRGWLVKKGWLAKKGEGPTTWDGPYRLADRLTYYFANKTGAEQNWGLFAPPMARRSPFLGTRYEFTDGTSETLVSSNEPDDPARYFRFGRANTRKYEDYMMTGVAEDSFELPTWSAYVRSLARHWHASRPDDPRELKRIVLVKRYFYFPAPGEPPGEYGPPEEKFVQAFTPDGRPAR